MNTHIEIVIILNFLVDLLLLMGTNRLGGYPASLVRSAVAAGLGGVYAGVCNLAGFQFLGNLLWRVVSLALVAWFAFGLSKSAVRRTFIFAMLRMALDGIILGLGNDSFWSLIAAAFGIFAICALGFHDKLGSVTYIPVELRYGEKHLRLTALRDTGNTLLDPVTGRPVLVVDAEIASMLTGLTQQQLKKPVEALAGAKLPGLRLIPYHTVGQSEGLLLALRIPQVRIGDWEGSTLVAFAPNGLSREGAYQALTGGVV